MRIEEMFLTAAEASCRLNDDKGARLMLNSLMQNVMRITLAKNRNGIR